MIDDLVSLFGSDAQDWGLRQGAIVTWDTFTGANTVRVGGAVLTDVPFLAQAGLVHYLPGDAVLLLRLKSSWAIVGRYVTPGANAAIGRYLEQSQGLQGPTGAGYALTTALVTRCTLSIPVPVWAEAATVTAVMASQARNSTASTDRMQSSILHPSSGILSTWTGPSVDTLKWGSHHVTSHFGQVPVTPGGTLDLEGQVRAIAAGWAADANNGCFLQATVTWNSNDG